MGIMIVFLKPWTDSSNNLGIGTSVADYECYYEELYGNAAKGVDWNNIEAFLGTNFSVTSFDACSASGNVSSENIFCYNTGGIGNQDAVQIQYLNQNSGYAMVYDPQAGGQRAINISDIYNAYRLR